MLDHFLAAQEPVYHRVQSELRSGEKQSHWMWFIFPQLRALGRSDLALRFGIADLEEAKAYDEHPVLGARLRECVLLANTIEGRSANQIFGQPDTLKFCSCLTLFVHATERNVFRAGLDKFYGGKEDPLTLAELGRSALA